MHCVHASALPIFILFVTITLYNVMLSSGIKEMALYRITHSSMVGQSGPYALLDDHTYPPSAKSIEKVA